MPAWQRHHRAIRNRMATVNVTAVETDNDTLGMPAGTLPFTETFEAPLAPAGS